MAALPPPDDITRCDTHPVALQTADHVAFMISRVGAPGFEANAAVVPTNTTQHGCFLPPTHLIGIETAAAWGRLTRMSPSVT